MHNIVNSQEHGPTKAVVRLKKRHEVFLTELECEGHPSE